MLYAPDQDTNIPRQLASSRRKYNNTNNNNDNIVRKPKCVCWQWLENPHDVRLNGFRQILILCRFLVPVLALAVETAVPCSSKFLSSLFS